MQPNIHDVKAWAAEAGEVLCKNFRQHLDIRHKGRFDLVTQVDTESEAVIIENIRSRFPGHTIVTEERGLLEGSGGTWFVDPLDGTINYAHGMPMFAVSLAYAEKDQVMLAVVYDPIREEFYTAERGNGAFLNDTPIRVSQAAELSECLLVTGFPYDAWTSQVNNLDNYGNFARRTQGVRRLGSAALDLCYVANGVLDGYWELKIKPWDIAAGTLIVEEAGGKVTNLHGEADYMKPPYSVIAANPAIHAEMLAVLKEAQVG